MKVLSKLNSLDNIQDGNTRKLITKTTSSGNGNAVTAVSVSGDTITYTKGSEFALSSAVPTKTSDLTNDSNFITNTGDTSGNAGSATQLKNARTIAIGTGATGTATSFNGTSNITIPITDVKDAYITWGGKNISGQISPDDMGCIDEFGHNKLAFLPAGCITVEYTTDGGTTWLDYGLTDEEKVKIVTTSGINLSIGKGTATASGGTLTNENCGNYKVRVKISTRNGQGKTSGYLYTQAKKWLLNVTTNGATGTTVLVENRSIANYNNDVDTWTTVGTYDVSGWSGWNSIPYNYTFGGGSNQTGQIADVRFTLSIKKVNVNYNCAAAFLDFRLIGQTNWSMPSELARTGHLYTMDVDQNATFPKKITANDFSAKKMIINTTKLPIANGKISSIAANNTYIGSDGIGMSNPGTPNDAGWLRMLGTGENDSVLELAVGDDGSSAAGSASNEEIAVRKYSTSNSISKEIKLFDKDNNSSFPGSITATGGFIGNLTGTASKATGDKNGDDITTTYYKASNPNGYTSNVGTITGITMNGTNKGTSGVVDLGTVAITDTKNTAGSTDSSSKLYLVGATSQAANPQTYSDNEIYATDGVLTTKSVQVGGTSATMRYNSTDKCIEFVFI